MNDVMIRPQNSDNWLFNGETFSKGVWLGALDKQEKWKEVNEVEKLEWEALHNNLEQSGM